MIALCVALAVLGSALAAPDAFLPQRSFGAPLPVTTLPRTGLPTRGFGTPQTFNDAELLPPRFPVSPVTQVQPQFAAPVAPVAPVASRGFNIDSSRFVQGAQPAGGFLRDAPAGSFTPHQPAITVVERNEYLNDNGEFSSRFQGSDGQTFQEVGKLKPTNDHLDNVVVKEGSYSYTSPEGIPVQVTYTADEYGFHPVSNSIPVAPAALPPTF